MWRNLDPYGMDVEITVTGYFPFTLSPYEGAGDSFDSPGVYSMESDWGDTGTLTVGTVTPPPSVSITNPVNNAIVPANTPFEIQVATTADAGMYSVHFYVENLADYTWTLIDVDFTEPFSVTTNLTDGSYNLHAYATDNNSQQDFDSIGITVAAVPATPIGLENPRSAGGQFLFDVTGLMVGKTNIVEYCTSLSVGAWTPIATNTAASTTASVTNAITAVPRFYRIHQMP